MEYYGNSIASMMDKQREESERYCPDCQELWRFCKCDNTKVNQETAQSIQSDTMNTVNQAKSEDTDRPSKFKE